MKATGVIRKVDELGRIVIPKNYVMYWEYKLNHRLKFS